MLEYMLEVHMPRMYSVPASVIAGIQFSEGTDVSFADLQTAFGNHPPLWLGESPPSLASRMRSQRATHVIVEVRREDGVNATFDRAGFYRLPDLHPDTAEDLLKQARRVAARVVDED